MSFYVKEIEPRNKSVAGLNLFLCMTTNQAYKRMETMPGNSGRLGFEAVEAYLENRIRVVPPFRIGLSRGCFVGGEGSEIEWQKG